MRAENGHSDQTFEQLSRTISRFSRRLDELTQTLAALEDFQAPNQSIFPPSPTQYLQHYEAITNPVEKRFFFQKFQEQIETGLRARDWLRIESESVARYPIPPRGSLSSQMEAVASVDADAARRFYRAHEDAINHEVSELQEKAVATRLQQDRV